ncbi:MAG: hypothetical protein GY828_08190 [Candidatus Gracilibacteria bacterium]|nr:hypothetical protein [Candidatus Gracilibacteria bacterium]
MNRRRNSVSKNFKDYLIPIIGGIGLLIIIISMFTGGEDTQSNISSENRVGITVSMDTTTTESSVEYAGADKVSITENIEVFKGETLSVTEGSLNLSFPEGGDARISKLGIVKYDENANFVHTSGKFWVNSKRNMKVQMRFGSVMLKEGSHVSLDQNEAASNIYVLGGNVEVQNLAGKSELIFPGEEVSIERTQAQDKTLNIEELKSPLSEIFKKDNWFVFNSGNIYLQQLSDPVLEVENKGENNITNLSTGKILFFDGISDEANVISDTLDISGSFRDETIEKITLAGKDATINKEKKTFTFTSVSTDLQQNDLVFRAIDDAGDVLEKRLITLYYDGARSGTNTSTSFSVKNYSVDASQFTFSAPNTSGVYKTKESFITIKGLVKNKSIKKVLVNGYKLNSFNTTYGTWRYHAKTENNNLKNGTNVYEVGYYDESNKLLYKNQYTIVKESLVPKKEENIISDEV